MLDHLFEPLALGPATLPNRIVSTSHQTSLVRDHLPTEALVAYHEERARGGVGFVVLEATAVHESGLLHAHTLAGYRDGIADGYRRIAAAVQRHGTRVVVQLFHGGREQIASAPRPPALAPSAIPSQRFGTEPRALSDAEVDELIGGYARAAELAVAGGLDGVEISAAHNYLVAQFFTPELNARDDRWRVGPAFLLAVVDAVRAAAPELALGVRLSADAPAAVDVAGALGGRVDYLSLALGESSTYRGSVGIVPPPPFPENAVAELTGPFRGGPPVIATTRVVDPVAADRLIREGRADAVGMTRALITDPHLPRKSREGRLRDVLRCIGCNACIAHYHAGTPIACAQNPRTGRELSLPPAKRVGAAGRIVVVGAGPAGLAAAARAARLRGGRPRARALGPDRRPARSRRRRPRPRRHGARTLRELRAAARRGGDAARRRCRRRGGRRASTRRRSSSRRALARTSHPRAAGPRFKPGTCWRARSPAGRKWSSRTGAETRAGSPPPRCWRRPAGT